MHLRSIFDTDSILLRYRFDTSWSRRMPSERCEVRRKDFVPVCGCKYPTNCLFREFYTSFESLSVASQSLPRANASRSPVFVVGQDDANGYFVREPHAWCQHGLYRTNDRVFIMYVCSIYSVWFIVCPMQYLAWDRI